MTVLQNLPVEDLTLQCEAGDKIKPEGLETQALRALAILIPDPGIIRSTYMAAHRHL